MRTEQEMYALILAVAQENECIRGVYMNGSRANKNAPKDLFQDYDIVYIVMDTLPFINNPDWIRVFGELLIKQEPDQLDKARGMRVDVQQHYTYLMLFQDGNRIDLQLHNIDNVAKQYASDKLIIPLLDKDGLFPEMKAPSDCDYFVKKPSHADYIACCNDFWWCLQNVAKGIWRDELPYAMNMYEDVIRANLHKVVSWQIAASYDFKISVGKAYKYLNVYMDDARWKQYVATYSNADYTQLWNAIYASCALFREVAKDLQASLGFVYNEQEDSAMMKYLQRVQFLPKDAKDIFS